MLLKIEADGLFWHSPLRVCWVPHTDFSKAPGLLESLKRSGHWLRYAAGGWQTHTNCIASLPRLLKNTRFVSGHRFSDAVTAAKPLPPSGGAFEL